MADPKEAARTLFHAQATAVAGKEFHVAIAGRFVDVLGFRALDDVRCSIDPKKHDVEQIIVKKVVHGGQPLPKGITLRESTITTLMKSCFDGTAFSSTVY